MTRVGLLTVCREASVAGTGLKCVQSGIFPSRFAFFGTISCLLRIMPVSCLRCADSGWVRVPTPAAAAAQARLPGLQSVDTR